MGVIRPAGARTANRETVFITLSQLLFNPWIAGLLLAAILAAIMSTLSCQLLVCSSVLTEDFYRALLRPHASQKELVGFSRIMVLLFAVVAIAISFNPDMRVLSLVEYAWAGFGSAFGPVVLLSLFWPRMTGRGALAGMITGAVTVIVWRNGGWFGLYEMIPGFFLACLAIVVVSLLSAPPTSTVTATFGRMQNEMELPRQES